MSLHVGLGSFSGQVPFDSKQSVSQTYRDILTLSESAEELGFDSVWVSEHHAARDSYLPSPVLMLGAIAAVTERIQLGTGVVLAPFQHPLRFAEDCAVVDQLSGGRLIIALGAGWRDREFDSFGISRSERGQRTAELAEICRAAWDQEQFSFDGKYFSFEDASVTPKPARHLPLLMGGTARAAIARAARLADGYSGTGTPQCGLEVYRSNVDEFDRAARDLGRDPESLPIGFHVNAWVSPNGVIPKAVLEAMWHQTGTYESWHAGGDPGRADDLPPLDEANLRRRAFAGTPDEVIAQARPWIEAFAERDLHVLFKLHAPGMSVADTLPPMRCFAEEVMPALREMSGSGPNGSPFAR